MRDDRTEALVQAVRTLKLQLRAANRVIEKYERSTVRACKLCGSDVVFVDE